MKTLALLALSLASAPRQNAEPGWTSLFDGKSLSGWKASENPSSVKVEDGRIVVNGPRAHLFYVGDVKNHAFRNFEFKAEVMTKANSNSGIYFHTEYQETNWPAKGFEAQVNNSYARDPRKTGSLYAVKDVTQAPAKDDEWFEYHILVNGKKVELRINGKTTVEWTEPEGFKNEAQPGRKLGSGTFALQAHDPGSTVYFRNLRVKPLPD